MSTSALLGEFVAGNVFGAALTASGVFEPVVITGQMELRSFHMIKAMMAACATSAFIVTMADHLGLIRAKPKPVSKLGVFAFDGNVVGGALLGLGMATTGACPGTSLVQLSLGSTRGRLVVLGGVLGAIVYPFVFPRLAGNCSHERTISQDKRSSGQAPTIHESLHLSSFTVLAGWEAMMAAVLYVAHVYDPAPTVAAIVSPLVGGFAIGLAQGVSLLLTRHTLSTSGMYSDVSAAFNYTARGFRKSGRLHFPPSSMIFTPAITFAVGVMSGAASIVAAFASDRYISSTPDAASDSNAVATLAVVGGALMVVGARLGGGCTSGHGISGMSTFSWSSLVATAAMLGGGIQTAWLVNRAMSAI